MCGIAGIYYFDPSRKVNPTDLGLMTDQIVHRGPNDAGVFIKNNIGLAMRRLSIIDLESGHQPIFNENRSNVIVFNGEAYNFKENRNDLIQKGCQFKTQTDTEVVLYLYQEYGLEFLKKINGMFGLAIWDDRLKRLTLARDRIGIKPLYYYKDNDKIVFASEIKSITALPFIKMEIDMEGLSSFLKYGFTPSPYTLFKNIKKIPPAHNMIIQKNSIRMNQYWRVSYAEKLEGSEKKITDELYELIKDSVKYRLISDVPLGAFLSSGIDSSSIVHMMNELNGGSKTISTYSIGFGKGFEFNNELEPASLFAKEYKTNHNPILVEPNVVDLFPRLIKHLDEPIADSSFIVTYLVSELAAKTSTVILSGVGGDELFGGYTRYLNIQLNKYSKLLPMGLRKQLSSILNKAPVDRNSALFNFFRLAKVYINSSTLPLQEQYASYVSVFDEDFRKSSTTINANTTDFYAKYFSECDSDDLLDKMMYFDFKTSLPDRLLMLTDKMSMATSLEARVPFLDHRVVEFAAKIPTYMKIKGFKLRYLQKKSIENRLPSYVLKKKKRGFGAPIGVWIRNDLREMVSDLLHKNRLKKQGIFNPSKIQNILDDHQQMRQDYSDQILALLTFQIWHDLYF